MSKKKNKSANNRLISDVKQEKPSWVKRNSKTLKFSGVAVVVVIISFFVGSFLFSNGMLGGNDSNAFGNDDDQEIARQKQELTETYSHMGVELVDDDFVVTRDNNGDIKVVLNTNKQDEVEAAKDNAINNLFDNRNNPSNPDDPDDGSNHSNDPGSQDPTNPDNPEDPEDPDNPDNKKIDEDTILEIINDTNSSIDDFFDRSLDSSNFYKDAFAKLLSSIRTGDPDPNEWYDAHPNYTNAEAFETLCAYVFINCSASDDDSSIWTNSFFWEYSGTTLYNCLKNETYKLKFDKINAIYEANKDFDFNGETLTSSYVVYANGHYVYLTYNLIVLDII